MRSFLNTVVFIMPFLFYSHQTVKHVNNCPSNEQSWKQRSSSFVCDHPHEEYHCIQNVEHILIEACMKVYNIPFYKVGCPWVKIHNGKAYLRNPFTPCDTMHTGCPKQFHKKYRSNELYMYPECIKSGIVTASVSTVSVTENTSVTQDSDGLSSIPQSFSLVIVFGCMIFIPSMFYVCNSVTRWNFFKRCSKAKKGHTCQEEVELLLDPADNTFKKAAGVEVINIEINDAKTDSGESISIKSFTELDVITATSRKGEENKIPESANYSRPSCSQGRPPAINQSDIRKRCASEPANGINIDTPSGDGQNANSKRRFLSG